MAAACSVSMADIDAADYAAWRSHFGQPPGSGSFTGGAIPEPATWIAVARGDMLEFLRRRARTA